MSGSEVWIKEPIFVFSAVGAVISLGGISGILFGIVLGKVRV